MVRNYGVETDQEEDSSLHMRVEFKLIRRSSRLHLGKEGTYRNTQGRLAKRRRVTGKHSTNPCFSNEPSKEPATNGSTNKTPNSPSETPSESHSENPMNPSGTSEPSEPSALLTSDTHVLVEGGEIASGSLGNDTLSQEDVFNILEEYFEQSLGSESVNDTEGLDIRPTLTVECTR
ncbi:hypothetical protein VE03_01529 [Pseudogymnoascus sp. 23342-1-I1]|nr:hypothetical protein VE03_01529 [Pseudogymnoascus sp. 23342-1-I1]